MAMSHVFGSDHRPIMHDVSIKNFKRPSYCDFNKLISSKDGAEMPIGSLNIKNIVINKLDFTRIEDIIFKAEKRSYFFPISLKITCYGEFIDYLSSTRVKRMSEEEYDMLNAKTHNKTEKDASISWSDREIPKMHTPISNVEALGQRTLRLSLWLSTSMFNPTVIGQLIIRLDGFDQVQLS
eukprot:CAMPEP_0176373158 /NCGR_PEP_ID=MMETSP0126-20121128/25859_1 /TAXON_ID=141414 ORGANISM="Strombidinopsis acuminatum, Strain SPMC142" /NCGR_SAMPLE_ID=MMETSP0126 /ASSEMBLY_ACC=CAM_ASM_000229 /LENGTH=180 /DNA_ID=CAMNT_0017733217 /DNA_START=305 /DNA_END=847 /DNA_ORIENTATION=-